MKAEGSRILQEDESERLPQLTSEQIEAALIRREKVRLLIGVQARGFLPPTREEFEEQLARQASQLG